MLNIKYLSHSAFYLQDGRNNVVIDPFIEGNPTAPVNVDDIKANYIVLTHAHPDHFGDTKPIALANKSLVIAVNELANYCSQIGLESHNMHIGGSYNFDFGKLKFTQAFHGSSNAEGDYMGDPAGVILNIGGKVVYHCGDTGIFGDMKLIGQMNQIDVMLVPIGGNFTMDIDDAVEAVKMVNPKLAIPMHYNTFPIIEADPKLFVEKVKQFGLEAKVLKYGEAIQF
jgi:L-ascorbate metabolism protein UlaG (beta-lactamase superfamily)